MTNRLRPAIIAAALAAAFNVSAATQTTTGADPARPADATANRPSDSGAQSTTPRGAVTGAGQPQGASQAPMTDTPKATAKKSKKKAKKRSAKYRAAATRPAREAAAGETPK